MKYVYAVYQNLSFSKAAKQLFITQPALSSMVRKAENEIGYPIFDRSTVPITVTEEGRFYIDSIEQIMSVQKNVQDYFQDLSSLKTGHLYIGGSSYFCTYIFSSLIGDFKERHPGISIDLFEGNISELKEGLQQDTLDLIIETALNEEDAHIRKFLLGTENITLAVPAVFSVNGRLRRYQVTFDDVKSGCYLDESRPAVPLQELWDTPFLLLKKGNDMYRRSMAMCRKAGFTPKEVMRLDQILTSFYIADTGVGAIFMRAALCRFLPSTDRLVFYKLGDPLASRPVYMACKKGRYISHAMRAFLEIAGANLDHISQKS